jgi:2-polyprenyl-3-methyl-5-hydroxy-6-metoxy-1,4-benzoquinol methylase
LDLGCGPNSPVQYLSESVKHVGLDAFEEAIHKSKAKGIHDEYYYADVFDAADIFGKNSFHAVVASDLIEHLPKDQKYKLMQIMEKISRRKSVLFTLKEFLQRKAYNNSFQKHLSEWTPSEVADTGYNVVGIKGVEYLRRKRSKIKYSPARIVRLISRLSQYFVNNRPELAL